MKNILEKVVMVIGALITGFAFWLGMGAPAWSWDDISQMIPVILRQINL